MKNLKIVSWIAGWLLVLGGLTWGLVGLFNFNLVTTILGFVSLSAYANVVYVLVGLSAIWVGWNDLRLIRLKA